jgi:hypothetical protein
VTPDVFKQMASLLKAYQEEVDSLTTRAKLGEAAFLEVFKQLYEAPDPAPAIAQGLVRLHPVIIQCFSLKRYEKAY